MEGQGKVTLGFTSAGEPSQVRVKVVVVAGPDAGAELALDGSLKLGTAEGNSLVLTDPGVSRAHLIMAVVDGRVLVRDVGSRNGTFVSDAKIVESEVQPGTLIRLGRYTTLSVQPRWGINELWPSTSDQFGELLGGSVAMRRIFAILQRAAPTDAAILLEGETGTGKEVAAHSIHTQSKRGSGPFVVFDCASVPRDLAESELFGHRRGAFSGATSDRKGAFASADQGTLFLDEIGELPLDLQPKLLRILETGQVRRVGDDTSRKYDVRVVAATNRDLRAEVERGAFREDLRYRLDVVRITLPPLRQRLEDLAPLVKALLKQRVIASSVTDSALKAAFGNYGWPGNVRELRNVLMRGVALSGAGESDPIPFDQLSIALGPATHEPASLGNSFPGVATALPYKVAKDQLLQSFDRAYLGALLDRHEGNISQAAKASELSRKHLYELLKKAGLDS